MTGRTIRVSIVDRDIGHLTGVPKLPMLTTVRSCRAGNEGKIMVHVLRRIGLALGSLVIAWLAVSLVAGTLLGTAVLGNKLVWLVTLVLGGLIYQDIIRREQPSL